MKTQKSDNKGNASKVLAFQLPKTKNAARTTTSNAENNEKSNSMGKLPGRKKDVKTRQIQPILSLIHSEEVLESRIAKRAYELYERRGRQHGYDREDWFQAEKDVLTKSGAFLADSRTLGETT
ncbi:MAG: DUF2934 domain-containing protein [Nitrospirota bacterium]